MYILQRSKHNGGAYIFSPLNPLITIHIEILTLQSEDFGNGIGPARLGSVSLLLSLGWPSSARVGSARLGSARRLIFHSLTPRPPRHS